MKLEAVSGKCPASFRKVGGGGGGGGGGGACLKYLQSLQCPMQGSKSMDIPHGHNSCILSGHEFSCGSSVDKVPSLWIFLTDITPVFYQATNSADRQEVVGLTPTGSSGAWWLSRISHNETQFGLDGSRLSPSKDFEGRGNNHCTELKKKKICFYLFT